MCHFEQDQLEDCPLKFKLAVYRWCSNPIFVLFKNKEDILLFVNYMNSKHRKIKFNFGFENDKFPILDFNITSRVHGFTALVP